MAAATKPDILQVFASATQADLDIVRGQIGDMERQLDGLRAVERCLNVRINGKKQRKQSGSKTKASGNGSGGGSDNGHTSNSVIASVNLSEKRKKVLLYLKANGPKSLQKLSESTGISRLGPGCLTVVIDSPWFHTNPDGIVSLTDKGESAVVL